MADKYKEFKNEVTLCSVVSKGKPNGDVRRIRMKYNSRIQEVTPEVLVERMRNGHSVHAAICNMTMNGVSDAEQKTFKKAAVLYQNIFFLDLDHGNFSLEDILNRSLVEPAFASPSSSSKADYKKWRVCYFSDKNLCSIEEIETLNKLFMTPFIENIEPHEQEEADTKCYDGIRISYAVQKDGAYVDNQAKFDPYKILKNTQINNRFSKAIEQVNLAKTLKKARAESVKKAFELELITEEERIDYILLADKKDKQSWLEEVEFADKCEALLSQRKNKKAKSSTDKSIKSATLKKIEFDSLTGEIEDLKTTKTNLLIDTVFKNLKKMNADRSVKSVSYHEAHNLILNLPLNELLGVELGANFKCYFHNDKIPSASVFKGEDGKTIYKCHSDGCAVKLNTYSFLMLLLQSHSYNLHYANIRKILSVMGIRLNITDFQKEAKVQLADCASFMSYKPDSDALKHKLNKKNLQHLYYALVRFANNLATQESFKKTGDEVVIHASFDEIYEFMRNDKVKGTSDQKMFKKKIKLLNYLGIFEVVKYEDLLPKYFSIAITNKKAKNHRLKSYYQFPYLDDYVWENALERFEEYEKSGSKLKNLTANKLCAATTLEDATRTYVQSKINLSENKKKLLKQVDAHSQKFLETQSYFTKHQILQSVDRNGRLYKTVDLREKVVDELLMITQKTRNLTLQSVNKETRKKYNIPTTIKSRTVIYTMNLEQEIF